MSTRILIASALFLAACGEEAAIPEQLEAVRVTGVGGEWLDAESLGPVSGTAAVVGSGRDLQLQVDDDEAEQGWIFELHSPSAVDLSALSGQVVSVDPLGWWEGIESVVIEDEAGLFYLADGGDQKWAFDELLGQGTITWGSEVAQDEEHHYWTIAVATDDGTVELLPGEVQTVVLDGQAWRFAAVTATTEVNGRGWFDEDPAKCMSGPTELLSWEMVRIDAEEEPEFVARRADLSSVSELHLGCGG